MEQNIKLGETIKSTEVQAGTKLTFHVGSFIDDPTGRLWCVLETMECYKGRVGLLKENGDPVDLNLYCIRVAKYARDRRMTALKYGRK